MARRLQDEVVELEKSVRRLREQFYGKVSIEVATVLMRRYGNNHQLVAMDIILMKDRGLDEEDMMCLKRDAVVRNVVQKLQAEEQSQELAPGPAPAPPRGPQIAQKRTPVDDGDIKEIADRLRCLPLTEKNVQMFNNAQRHLFPSETCQFACQPCDKDWWRRVPQRKKVSRCHGCRTKYDPVPPNLMWGLAEFHCHRCNRTFRGFGRMDVGSPCYTCHIPILPIRILPPRRSNGPRQRNQHSCCAEDCYNRQEPHVPGTECVHPRSRTRNHKPRVVNPSPLHASSGSTVATCLSQGSLYDLYQLIMDDICEEEEEGGGGASSGSSTQ
ncbi:shiftless antiviral inhibitor of ribosomal frameshifting protein homolog isoform X2 [Lepisosteus oculatus]|uniref:shiftless antiviral inhibitor of ribosomal frameshifting protein homolog isoform X2 n=1 Tax=Lepisosteus oculatus TaxID=7918 RepID=UPI0035F51677